MATATDEKIAADLASFRSEVARDLASFRAEVARDLHGLAEFRGGVRNDLRWIKGIGASLLLAGLSFAGWITWQLATLSAEVAQHGDQFGKVETRFVGVDSKLDGLDERMDGLDKRMDGLDKRMDGLDKRMDGLDKRMDGLDGKLDILIQRTAPKSL